MIQIWKDKKEEPSRFIGAGTLIVASVPRPGDFGWLRQSPPDEYANKPTWQTFETSTPGIVRVQTGGSMFCRIEKKMLKNGDLIGTEFVVLPAIVKSLDAAGKESTAPETAIIEGKKVTLSTLVPAERFRLTAEEYAKALLDEEIAFIEWKSKTSTAVNKQTVYTWESHRVDVRRKSKP